MMNELNDGGFPVKNASYWRKRHLKAEAEIESLRRQLDKMKNVLNIVEDSVRTSHLDIGGNHKYVISHKDQQHIGEVVQAWKEQL